jgi:hypothetical protein
VAVSPRNSLGVPAEHADFRSANTNWVVKTDQGDRRISLRHGTGHPGGSKEPWSTIGSGPACVDNVLTSVWARAGLHHRPTCGRSERTSPAYRRSGVPAIERGHRSVFKSDLYRPEPLKSVPTFDRKSCSRTSRSTSPRLHPSAQIVSTRRMSPCPLGMIPGQTMWL